MIDKIKAALILLVILLAAFVYFPYHLKQKKAQCVDGERFFVVLNKVMAC